MDRKTAKSGIDLIDEAVHLLRAAPVATIAAYYAGAIPFIVGFLYFWTDMSQDPFATAHIADGALITAVLFIWMKFWQALFARLLRMQLASDTIAPWSLKQSVRVLLAQLVIQPSGLFLIPCALLFMVPFAWVYGFYQNVTANADADGNRSTEVLRNASRQTWRWPEQNHLTLAIVSAFGLFILMNIALTAFLIPGLLKQFFGIESAFSRSPMAMLNTTFIAAVCGLTYLCVDPLLKTIYVLRCFYGESLTTGEDLKARMKQFSISSRSIAVVAILWVVLGCALSGNATPAEPAPAAAPQSHAGISGAELNRQIDDVIQQRKFAWRMPRADAAENESDKGVITRFLEKSFAMLTRWTGDAIEWVGRIVRYLFEPAPNSRGDRNFRWMSSSLLLYVLLATVLSIFAVYFIRVLRRRSLAVAAFGLEPMVVRPDITDENVSADQMPEDEWESLARELLRNGQFRLAMRAFYLASLANLARRNLVRIARYKSNLDYENELRRRGHAISEILPAFGENVAVFERVWYGAHNVSADLVQQFSANVDRIRSAA